jgi:serine/threonine-protein kinase
MVAAPYGDISTNNPPPTRAGMVQVNLEAGGKLRWFSAMPSADAADLAQPVEPAAVFRLAGLDPATFTETAPKFVPLGAADQLRAWKGPHPKIPNLDLTVEMAFWKGRVTAVHVLNNWKDDQAAGEPVSSNAIGIVLLLVSGIGVLAGILLARRNWKLGRIDRKGALRIGMAGFFLGMLIWLGTVHAIPSSDMIGLFFSSLAVWLIRGAGFWLLYLALEPSVRAHWPHSLVTWNRLLAGRWRDAQVGSHILIGAAVGSVVWVAAGLVEYFSGIEMGRSGALDPALGTRHWVAYHAGMMASALAVGLVLFFALTGLRRLVRKDWIAAILASLFFTVVNVGSLSAPNWKARSAVYLGIFAVLLLVLLRYGLVTIMAAVLFLNTIDDLGLGPDWKAWYVPSGLATLALLLGIAIYAFWRSLGTRDLFDKAAG